MLVAERDLQMKDVFAVALEAEMAGLDDARVHGAHGDLVNLLTLDPVEIGHAHDARLALRAAEGIGPRAIGAVESHRL